MGIPVTAERCRSADRSPHHLLSVELGQAHDHSAFVGEEDNDDSTLDVPVQCVRDGRRACCSRSGAVAAPTPPQDFVVGSGDTFGPFLDISIDAHSDASGGNPSGTVSFVVVIGIIQTPVFGAVTCLAVDGNRAIIGLAGPRPLTVLVADNSPAGSLPDAFAVVLEATDCSTDPSGPGFGAFLSSGDIVVRDAPTRTQCLDGGWHNYTDATGHPFRNQGECVAFALGTA